MKRILLIVGVTALAIAAFTLATRTSGSQETADEGNGHGEETETESIPLTQKQVSAVDLRMGEVESRELDATISVNGELVLRPQSVGEVTSLMEGVVKEILVSDGDRVRKGQVVATVENTDVVSLQREYYSAFMECSLAKAEMERQQTLNSNGGGIRKNLQEAEKRYRVAKANATGIARQLSQMGISTSKVAQGVFTTTFPLRAPINGTVSRLTASVGSHTNMQSPLMSIRDNNSVECDLNVFERDINKVKNGDRVLLSLTNQQGAKVAGRVYGMNEYFNEGTKSVAVHVRLEPAEGLKLFDGMYVSGSIATGRQRCNTLPTKAIVSTDGKDYIFALNETPKDGKYEFSRHEVTTGAQGDGYTEVELCKHIRKGQKIVTSNAFYLASLTGEHGEHEH